MKDRDDEPLPPAVRGSGTGPQGVLHAVAEVAAARVGYESPSPFDRDFRRFLGRTPGEEARCMKTLFSLLPPAQLEALTMKH